MLHLDWEPWASKMGWVSFKWKKYMCPLHVYGTGHRYLKLIKEKIGYTNSQIKYVFEA